MPGGMDDLMLEGPGAKRGEGEGQPSSATVWSLMTLPDPFVPSRDRVAPQERIESAYRGTAPRTDLFISIRGFAATR